MKMIANCSGDRVGADDSIVASLRTSKFEILKKKLKAKNENYCKLFSAPRWCR